MTSSARRSIGDLFATFQREAFRLETLDDYSQSGSVDAYRMFREGRPKPADYNTDWLSEVRGHTDAGRRMYRVHVLSRPLTTYLRFELGWGYVTNTTAGEEFYILDVTERANPLPDHVGDFWLFDGTTPARFSYDAGKFAGADVLQDDDGPEYARYRDTALAHAVPFADWWAEYGE
ncbi:DUF6879 family protein [Antribacter gilvus]|uniref:DUF6879 family protein n=1 Tax=Antribacter gilvus TaxID=2304675 RepID=UPI000F792518|nr:DUF6879 family protein [Antribacter gilvus]